ncbi:MAG: hypothetical protein HFJ65_06420 [Eggerthellaceae bacterium]|nr:hypothetical protein [Eggerthellaceae bacterium]
MLGSKKDTVFAMKKTIRKIFSVLVAACMCTSMLPATALAEEPTGPSASNSGSFAPDNPYVFNKATAKTDVYAIAKDYNLGFSNVSTDQNFANAADAITNTADGADPGPLFAEFSGTSGAYEYSWSLDDVTLDAQGQFVYSAHAFPGAPPTFTGPDSTSGTFGTEGAPGSKVSANLESGSRFTHSITAADGLQDNSIYRYKLTVYSTVNPGDTLEASILVSTYDKYQNQKLYANQEDGNGTSVQGFIYKDASVVPILSTDEVSDLSPVYSAMAGAAAAASPSQLITPPVQLTLTNLENLDANTPPYMLKLTTHIAIPTDPDTGLKEGDECTVYRYDHNTNQVQAISGKVVQQRDHNNNPVVDSNGNPVLSAEIAVDGTSASLGAFAIGYKNESGSFSVESSAGEGGFISPAGTEVYAVGTSPKFVLYPQAGYVIDTVNVKVDGASKPVQSGTLEGNSFTLSQSKYQMADGESWTVEAVFKKAQPLAEEYTITAKLSGPNDCTGNMSFTSAKPGSQPNYVYMNSQNPPAGEGGITFPSSHGVNLEFNAGVGFKLKTLKINGQEYSVVGTSYFISALTENLTIEAEYAPGLPDALITRTIEVSVQGGNGVVSDGKGGTAANVTLTANFGSSATVTLIPSPNYMLDTAILKTKGSTEDGTDISGDSTQVSGQVNVQVHNILEDMELVVTFRASDCTVDLTVKDDIGGTVSPSGPVQLASGQVQPVRITPDPDGGYELGRITMNGTPVPSGLLTKRGSGANVYYTFNMVNAQENSAEYEINGDKVLLITDSTATVVIEFNPVKPPAPETLMVMTSVDGEGGSITPSFSVEKGQPAQVWVYPDEGKTVDSILVDGVNKVGSMTEDGALLEIPASEMVTDKNVVVKFKDGTSPLPGKKKWTVHASAGTGGSVSPAGDLLAYDGTDMRFLFAPSTGYEFSKLQVNGADMTSSSDIDGNNFTLKNITSDVELIVTFAKSATSGTERDSYKVIVSAGPNGQVNPSGEMEVARGTNMPITIIPDDGYMVDAINVGAEAGGGTVNMVSDMKNGVYTLFDVQEDQVVEVTFKEGTDPDQPSTDPNNMIKLGPSNVVLGPGIMLDPNLADRTYYKEAGTDHANVSEDITIKVASGYAISELKVNGKVVTPEEISDGIFKFTLAKEDITQLLKVEVSSKEETPSTQKVDLKTITLEWEGNGEISPAGVKKVLRVESGQSQTLYFIPEAGNRLDSVTVNGQDVMNQISNFSYTMSSVTQDMRVQATFVEDPNAPAPPATVTVNVRLSTQNDDPSDNNAHGYSSIGTDVKVVKGGDLSITFKPDEGYQTNVYMGSNDSGTNVTSQLNGSTLHLTNLQNDTDVFAKFTKLAPTIKYLNVETSTDGNGRISPEGITQVVSGEDLYVAFLANDGYVVDKVYVTRGGNSEEVSSQVNPNTMTYKITDITEDVQVWASFKPGNTPVIKTWMVTATAGTGGMVSPSSLEVVDGVDAQVTIMPLRGYEIESVYDGSNVTETVKAANGVYHMPSVSRDHNIMVSFKKVETVNPSANKHDVWLEKTGNGQISPSGVVSVPAGGSVGFTMIPDDGYKIGSITATRDGITVPVQFSGFKCTIFTVTQETHVMVTFVPLDPGEEIELPNFYNITATASVNGSISPTGVIKVAEGGMSMFSFTPNEGAKLDYLIVDDEYKPLSEISRGQYEFLNVTADHTIHAVFCAEDAEVTDFVTINAGKPSGGTISPSGAKLVQKGTNPQYNVAPFYGYELADIQVGPKDALVSIFGDGPAGDKDFNNVTSSKALWNGSVLTLKNVQEDMTIVVTFKKKDTSSETPVTEYSQVTINGAGPNSGGSASFNEGTTIIEALKDGETLDISFIPDPGKKIGSLTVNCGDGTTLEYTGEQAKQIWQKGYITLTAAQVNPQVSLSVSFVDKDPDEPDLTPQYTTITAQAIGRGTVSPHGIIKIAANSTARFSMVPMAGYELSALRVDNQDKMGSLENGRNYTFGANTGDHTLEATFSQVQTPDMGIDYLVKTEIVAENGAGGNASFTEQRIIAGESATLYFWPNSNSKLTGLTVITGGEETYFDYDIPEYIIPSVTADTTVRAHFAVLGPDETTWMVNPIEIKASVGMGGHGKISPESAKVPENCAQTFTILPDSGYEVSFLVVNDEIIYVDGNIRSYSMIPDASRTDNSIEVNFKAVGQETPDVTVTAEVKVQTQGEGEHATIWPSERTVPAGTPVTFYIQPEDGYTIHSVDIEGEDIDFYGVKSPETTEPPAFLPNGRPPADFAGGTQTAAYNGGASISTAKYVAAEGEAPNTFYSLYGVTITASNKNVVANVIMKPLTEKNIFWYDTPVHTLEITSNGGGTVNPVGKGFLAAGATENIRVLPINGYVLDKVTLTYTENGQEVVEDMTGDVIGSNLKVTMKSSDMKVHATFKLPEDVSWVDITKGDMIFQYTDPDGTVHREDISGQVKVDPTLPGRFPKYDGSGVGTDFEFDTTGLVGPNGRPLVLDKVLYNGKPVTFIPDSNWVNVKLTEGGKFDVTFREIEEGHEIITLTKHTVTAKVTAGQGTVSPASQPVRKGGNAVIGFEPADGWMANFDEFYDWYAEEEGGEKVAHKIPASELANGYYELKGVDRDHEITVAFMNYVEVDIGWVNGDNGYVTPNTMAGQPIQVEYGTALSFIVAPYEGYDVEYFKFMANGSENDYTGSLRQSAATTNELLAMEGHGGFTVKNTVDGMGVTSMVADPAAQAATASAESYVAAPQANASASPALRNFNYAYGYTSGAITNDTNVRAAWTDESNVQKPELRTISVEIIGDMGGTVEPMPATGYDGEFITFNFIPDEGWQVVLLGVDGANPQEYSATSYTYGPINGDGSIQVGFDSIAHPGTNDAVARILRTLKALAQTGDLTAPLIASLLGIAVIASGAAMISYRRRNKKAAKHS